MDSDAIRRQKEYSQIIAKAWTDEQFKSRLLREPVKVLQDNGISVPENVEIRVVENSKNVIHLVLPARPDEELREEQLRSVSAAANYCFTACDPIACFSW